MFLIVISALLVVAGAVIGEAIYRAIMSRREEMETLKDGRTPYSNTLAGVPDRVRRRFNKISLFGLLNRKKTIETICEIVQEETKQITESLHKEYSAKIATIVEEKNTEIAAVRKEVRAAEEKILKIETLYKKADSEKKTTEAVVKSISEGLVVVNQKGEVLLMNPSAEKLLGVKNEEKMGKALTQDAGEEVLISLSREEASTGDKIVEYRSKDEGIRKVIRSSSAVIQNEDGQTIGMVNVLTDVTKQKELEATKNKFVSNVTHELRTPIVAMQNAVVLLSDATAGPLNTTQTKFVDIVSRNLNHLRLLVEDILDIAKIDAGQMKIRFRKSNMPKVVHQVCDTLEIWSQSKDIKIEREIDEKMPDMAFDPDKVTQILINLIGNAVKFTPKGGKVMIMTSMWLDQSMAQISVIDSGVGISEKNMQKLFKRFEQFGDQQGISGTGLGLCIAKEIVERHDGKITVQSEEGKGSNFTFTVSAKLAEKSEGEKKDG